MITTFAKGGSLLRAHPPGESSLQHNSFFISNSHFDIADASGR